MDNQIVIEVSVEAVIDKVWQYWTVPEFITQWNFASDDWCCPSAENDLSEGGHFSWRMEAKSGDIGFDFSGTYDVIVPEKLIRYTLDDGRKVSIEFISDGGSTQVIESFEPESMNPAEMQKTGWQMILNNFKKLVETS